jgi:toxin-antitoxin system PIN domain toxin
MSERVEGADLLDVNVWFALAVENHPHHAAAQSHWHAEPQSWRYFCRSSAMSLVRLLTTPAAMENRPLTLPQAWRLYSKFRQLPRVGLMSEPNDLEPTLTSLIGAALPTRHLTDAYLAAFAKTAGLRLVTFDRDFSRFDKLDWRRLEPSKEH